MRPTAASTTTTPADSVHRLLSSLAYGASDRVLPAPSPRHHRAEDAVILTSAADPAFDTAFPPLDREDTDHPPSAHHAAAREKAAALRRLAVILAGRGRHEAGYARICCDEDEDDHRHGHLDADGQPSSAPPPAERFRRVMDCLAYGASDRHIVPGR